MQTKIAAIADFLCNSFEHASPDETRQHLKESFDLNEKQIERLSYLGCVLMRVGHTTNDRLYPLIESVLLQTIKISFKAGHTIEFKNAKQAHDHILDSYAECFCQCELCHENDPSECLDLQLEIIKAEVLDEF